MQTRTEAQRVADYLDRTAGEAELQLSEGESAYMVYGRLVTAMRLAAADLRSQS